jgi:hypothetical protein
VLFCLYPNTSQSSSIIPPAFRTYMAADFGVFVYWCFISVDLNERIIYSVLVWMAGPTRIAFMEEKALLF